MVNRIQDMEDKYGDTIALKDSMGQSMPYKQMATRENRISLELTNKGLGLGSCVGLFQMPGTDWVCSLLAIFRIGAICVPLDLQVGQDRLNTMVKDCQPLAILVDSETQSSLQFLADKQVQVICVSYLSDDSAAEVVPSRAQSSGNAILTYTSGSMGVPKGVSLKHRSYTNFFEFAPPRWGFREGQETVLQQSSCAFDISICQILTCLGYGGTLVIVGSTKRRDPAAICDTIVSEGVTFTLATPSEYHAWIRYGKHNLKNSQWRGAMCGGQSMTPSVSPAFKSLGKPEFRLTNCYGPTEATIGCADSPVAFMMDGESTFALSPLPNNKIQIVDELMRPLPVGMLGQVAIGGAGAAAGYFNREQFNRTSFLPDANASKLFGKQGWKIIYLSEDRGQMDTNGRLSLHRRSAASTQIKMAGIRMDLEDIENNILRDMAPHVNQAVVSFRRKKDESQYLVAFVVLSSTEISFDTDLIPQTISNKVDRVAVDSISLPQRVRPADEDDASSVLSELEESLRGLWEKVLPKEASRDRKINKALDFFSVGGSSLSLVNPQFLIKEKFNVEVPIYRLFEAITLGQMALLLHDEEISGRKTSSIDWSKEVEPESDHDGIAVNNHVTKSPAVIVLTGSTGFLGMEVLRKLISNRDIIKIYCIAVPKSKDQLQAIFTHPKVALYGGDLGAPQLGLSNEDPRRIFEEADVVVHVGADVSFMKTYRSLKLINVSSTKELVKLSLPRRLPFHFISSATVARLSGQEIFGPSSVRGYRPDPETTDSYTAAKWVCEVYLENVSRYLGLPVVIHRPSSITGEGAPKSDLMSNVNV